MLYSNIIYWDYEIETGETVALIRYPFAEWNLDPICKVLTKYPNFSLDLEVIQSNFLTPGTILNGITMEGLKRVKLLGI